MAESARFFPIVGALVGAGAIGIDLLFASRGGRSVSVVLILIYLVVVTGGLHEDGLADAADGFGGGWTKERVLTIMRDSNIGSYGALAIVCSLLARFVFLTSLPHGEIRRRAARGAGARPMGDASSRVLAAGRQKRRRAGRPDGEEDVDDVAGRRHGRAW